MFFRTLPKKEVLDAINGVKSPSRVPSAFLLWPPDPTKHILRQIKVNLKYPGDIKMYYPACYLPKLMRGCINLGFDTVVKKGQAKDTNIKVKDYDNLEEFFAKSKKTKRFFCHPVPWSHRYRLGMLWNCIFETSCQVRGTENLLMDLYLDPEGVHKMFRGITDFYKAMIIKYQKASRCNGILITDDLGTQESTFFSDEIFREFFLPYYKEIGDLVHERGMHLWFHSCGYIKNFLPMLIEAGVDVLHPIQKYANDEVEIFEEFKNKITFLYGFDVQQTIPNGSVQEIREEVRRGYDLFSQAEGRFMYTAGNGILANCPIESYEALVQEARLYNPYKKQREKALNGEVPIVVEKESACNKNTCKCSAKEEISKNSGNDNNCECSENNNTCKCSEKEESSKNSES